MRTFFFTLTIIVFGAIAAYLVLFSSSGCPPVCVGVNLRAQNLSNVDYGEANLTGANLSRSNLDGANLTSADLSGADLTGVDLQRANLTDAKLIGANLENADLTGAILVNTNFNAAKLNGATLTGEVLTGVTLTGVQFRNAQLIGIDLSGINLEGAKLGGANLTGAKLNKVNLPGSVMSFANLGGSNLEDANLVGANLSSANLTGADLSNANLTGANLSNANLSGADLSYANLSGVDMANANLSGTNLTGSLLVESNLENAILHGTTLFGSDFRQVNLTSVDLNGVKHNLRTKWPHGFASPSTVRKQTVGGNLSGLNVALLTSGQIIEENAWAWAGYEGIIALGEAGALTNIHIVEPHQLDSIREVAQSGTDIIVGHGSEYSDALPVVAEEYPDVKFILIGGTAANGHNLASYQFRSYEASYVVGVLAESVFPAGKFGSLGGKENPAGDANINAFAQAVKQRNATASKPVIAFTNSWFDAGKGKELATELIEQQSLDLIVAYGDGPALGAIEAAKAYDGVYVIGWTRDRNSLGPEVVLTSVEQRIDNILINAVADIQDGTLEWAAHTVGFAEKGHALAPLPPHISSDVQNKVKSVIFAILDGKIVFDNAGNVIKDDYHRQD